MKIVPRFSPGANGVPHIAPAFDVHRGNALRKQTLPHQGRETDLSADIALPERAHPAIGEPCHRNVASVLDPGIRQDSKVGLARQRLEPGFELLAKCGTGSSDHIDFRNFFHLFGSHTSCGSAQTHRERLQAPENE
jgi:hypothetical protein